MIAKSDAASILQGTRGSGSIEISVPGAFTAVVFSGQHKNPVASAAERGRPSLFKTIDEDRRERHDHINRSGRSTYPGRISVQTSGATPGLALHPLLRLHCTVDRSFCGWPLGSIPVDQPTDLQSSAIRLFYSGRLGRWRGVSQRAIRVRNSRQRSASARERMRRTSDDSGFPRSRRRRRGVWHQFPRVVLGGFAVSTFYSLP